MAAISGRFEQHESRVALQVRVDRRGIGGKVGDGNTDFPEDAVAELARRPIHAVGHQDVVASRQESKHGMGQRGQPGGHQHGAGSTFDGSNFRLQGAGCRRPIQPV